MASTYDIGDVVRVTATFTTSTGNSTGVDPAAVHLHLETPSGVVTSQTYSAATGDVVKDTTGVYYIDITTTEAGIYEQRFTSTGTVTTSVENWFSVRNRRVTT
jgi:hypothetical protein